MRKETPDILLDCFNAVSKKISGMHTEIGADDSVWLILDHEDMPGAVMWRSYESFLFGDDYYYSVFRLAQIAGERGCWHKFLRINRWIILLLSCSSPEELQLMMACIG